MKKLSNSLGLATGLLGLLSTSVMVSCSPGPAPAANGRVSPTYRSDTGRLEKLVYDRNGDGRDDAWTFMDGTRLLRAELDDDYDGRVDRREFYAAERGEERAGGTVAVSGPGVLERVELLSATGIVIRTENYDKSGLLAAAEDTTGDGRPDKWEQYTAGALTSVSLDTQGRGKPDRRLVYTSAGGAPRIETDPDGSGHFRPAAPAQ
jgi:hypothetical protein